MLEGAVARLLNHLLGKYVVDLDTENLNVGIFSGHVQLTDLKLKAEALYELNLPIEVKAGTIGKIWLQIPWTSLWSQPVVLNIEDLHIVSGPIVVGQPFDPDKNKRLVRAFKRKILADLDTEGHVIGGPNSFSEHLLTRVLNSLQFNINNIHVRYEDNVSYKTPISMGLCVGSITAETTNSKWRAGKNEKTANASHYLIKIETFSAYCNSNSKESKWDLPSQYYAWRNAMSASLQNFSLGNEIFEFLMKPMTSKIKILMKKSNLGVVVDCATEVVVQDCNAQISKEQFDAILAVRESLSRMLISWDFLASRPCEKISEDRKKWWRYACNAVLEQRVRPYTWSKIKSIRKHYRGYVETYKQIILNPNDTELKLDLQQFEDNLSIVNIVLARQQARLIVQSRSLSEKNFWSMLPSPERSLLCKQIGFYDINQLEQNYSIRVGNVSLSLTNNSKDILLLTLTQTSLNWQPNFMENLFKVQVKVEGLLLEGSNEDEHLISIMASEHLINSPAYFFKMEFEKLPTSSRNPYRLHVALDSVECLYNKLFSEDLKTFLSCDSMQTSIQERVSIWVNSSRDFLDQKLLERWDIILNIKIPFLVIPQYGSFLKADNILVLDLGRYSVTTEICDSIESIEDATQMELEEQLYSKLHIECSDMQILFCQNSDNWKDERKEKDTDLHIIPKTNFSATYAKCTKEETSIPRYKFNISFHTLKMNMSERKIAQVFKFLAKERVPEIEKAVFRQDLYCNDRIIGKFTQRYLAQTEAKVSIKSNLIKVRKKSDKSEKVEKNVEGQGRKEDMNEAWARYVDLPGLEDNISPNNNIQILLRFVINEFSLVFSRSSDSTDRQYLMFRVGVFTTDIALMSFGPAYQVSINSILLTDKLHTTSSGQYLDLIHSPFPSTIDVVTILYRKVSASCPDFWTHFHGVETSLVADFGTIHLLLHQEAVHTLMKYSKYLCNKIQSQVPHCLGVIFLDTVKLVESILHQQPLTPVPPGSVKFSHSARLADVNIRLCDSDFDIINIQLSGLEMDFLFRANERFVFRSYLGNVNVEHLSEVTLYSKVLSTDEDKVFEVKYVRHADSVKQGNDISPHRNEFLTGGSLKFHLGQIHLTILYKLVVQIQRFIKNLEAMPFINQLIVVLATSVKKATDTLTGTAKINLAINICGPVLLIPQKSSSPNVLVVNTGQLTVENFFKEYDNDTSENILLKWTDVTVTRGVMTLTPCLEMQETLIEPVNLNVDIKHYTKMKTPQKSWDIDGAIDPIQITLGQKDISIILSIVTDNIGEGRIADLFPDRLKSPVDVIDVDETVKNLEAFFCEPKQKNIVAKFSLDEVTLSIFFDSGELLSSPIRDLNHGLCKFKVADINATFTLYNDGSMDGKFSADSLLIEEIGPDANIYEKAILQSPSDDVKSNNNCNITINRAPIIDITFHQNKSRDKSADVIIGRLSLSLSVPLCEKLALFILECLPKDNSDIGIINHGYECDTQVDLENFEYSASVTVSLRINKPEFIFIVETASNKKRYFVTRTEILADYSRHGKRLNLVLSLSGLHSLFYDVAVNTEPYTILKQCDLEFSNSHSEEKGKKIIASISSIYVQMCSRVVHSITDVLTDIAEHFKVPEIESLKAERLKNENEDLWEPKKIEETHAKKKNSFQRSTSREIGHEILLIPKFDIVVIFELEETQVLLVKSTMETTIYDWSSLLNCTCELTLQANYFNEELQVWEPAIDPVVIDEKEYKPWDVLIKIFQDKSLPMLGAAENKAKSRAMKNKKMTPGTTEDEDSGEDMMYLEPLNPVYNRNNRRVKTSLSTFLDDSDSENEDGAMEKLAAAISDLFTGDWNESEDSDYIHSSDGEDSDDNLKSKSEEKSDFGNFTKSTYVLIDAKETLNISITPALLKLLNELVTMYSNKTLSVVTNRTTINLVNDVGPQTKVELFEKQNGEDEEDCLVCVKTFENQDSPPNSPKSVYYVPDFTEDMSEDKDSVQDEYPKADSDPNYDFATISSLQFPTEATSQLYDKMNNHYLRVWIPNCQKIQTNCPKKKWQKFMRIHSPIPNQPYFLAGRHTIGKNGRNAVISSPLQIKNETCFALSVLYQPSILQQMNLEPVGDVTNPFENTMRIAVLEAHEHYNVPLYIAYHCKLFIQPAYAEGHYTSDCGIWWQDLATDLDIAHNVQCRPRSDSNLEVFSLRVMLTKNLGLQNSHSVPNYTIHLLPPLIFHNFLPYSLEVENIGLKQLVKIEPGEQKSVYSLDLSKDQKLLIRVKYNLLTWSGILNFTTYLDEKVVVLSSENKDSKQLAINTRTDRESSCHVFFYTPYWIINKTGLPLQIKATATNAVYESNNEDILLFTYKRHGKQTLNVKVYDSNWSNDFGLECAGTIGLVICKDNERRKKYLFFLSIKLSQMCPRLTKIVTLLPSFLVTNNTNRNLRFMEHNEKTDLWIDLASNQTVIFWPETSSMQMYVKYRDSKAISQAFNISTASRTVLRMDKGGALTVEVSGGISDSFRINFYNYKPGDAPILVRNYCADLFLKIQQQEQSQVTLLSPYNSLLYTWDDPTKTRKLVWNIYNNKGAGFLVNIFEESHGEEKILFRSVTPSDSIAVSSSDDSDSCDSVKTTANKIRRDKIIIYWLCYREGLQRILLFTQDLRIYNEVLKNYFLEHCEIECLVSLSGLGISIFTSENCKKEHVHVSLADAPAIWEVNVGHKWKTLTLELASWIEDKYRLHYKKCQLRDYIHIDFEKMFMLKPFFAELKRTYTPAVYLQLRKSRNYNYLNFKLNILQIDNKISSSIVLHPLPTNSLKGLTSFVDVNILKSSTKDYNIYKHLKINIRDFYLNIETDLLMDVKELVANCKKINNETTLSYVNDMKSIQNLTAAKPKDPHNDTIIEYLSVNNFDIQLHISNKTHLSMNSNNFIFSKLLDYLFPINISPYMPMEGVIHRISAIEHTHLCEPLGMTVENVLQQIASHFLQQYYSHVLGLQVLVNTFAIQPAIMHTPSELEKMGNVLLYGSRCLLSHINMSPAALEQCVIDIFANQTIENIQRMRRHGSYQRSEIVPKVITASSRNFQCGVPNALNQLIVKTQNAGINCDGEMFFRTTGKALLSLVTRHPDEKSDSVEVAREALRRASILGEPIRIQQRLTRYYNKYLGLKPFSVYESMGEYLLETVANSRFSTDVYWSHATTDRVGKSILLISLQHVIKINKCRLWGPWDIEWVIDLDDIISMPKITSSELVINMRQSENNTGKTLRISGDKEMLVCIHEKIEQAIIVSMEDKSWTVAENP